MYLWASGISGLLIGGAVGAILPAMLTMSHMGPAVFLVLVGCVVGAVVGCVTGVRTADKLVERFHLNERTILSINVLAWLCGIGWFLMETYAGW